jgi:hypothetical protein
MAPATGMRPEHPNERAGGSVAATRDATIAVFLGSFPKTFPKRAAGAFLFDENGKKIFPLQAFLGLPKKCAATPMRLIPGEGDSHGPWL